MSDHLPVTVRVRVVADDDGGPFDVLGKTVQCVGDWSIRIKEVGMNTTGERSESEWRSQSRPMMVTILVSLTVFFFWATFHQLGELNRRIESGPTVDSNALLGQTACIGNNFTPGCLAMTRMNRALMLEATLIARRHHQADVNLMASVWSRYLGFITGMILALVGAAFTLGQLRDKGTKIEAGASSAKATLTSASPGIVMTGSASR